MPEQIAKRLHDYIQQEDLTLGDRVFPICYSTARALIKNLGGRLRVVLTPHDLRRYSATYSSRNGVPLEIVSKVRLRHQDLKTTQAYLGRVTEEKRVIPSLAEETASGSPVPPMMRIRSSSQKPEDAFVAVPYRNHWFWIDDKDLGSKGLFPFLMFILNLADTGVKEGAPVVTISAS